MTHRLLNLLPGVLLINAMALAARLTHSNFPSGLKPLLGEVIIGLVFGLIVGNCFTIAKGFQPGIVFCFNTCLKIGIVLLGLQITLKTVLEVGAIGLAATLFLLMLALFTGQTLAKRLDVSSRLGTLIAVGTAICGNTAISALSPAIQASDEETSFAIATNTLFGTLAVLLYPFIGHLLGLNTDAFGLWAGTAVNDTSQVLAVGFSYSDAAGQIATTVKLARNALMGIVIVAITWSYLPHQTKREGSLWKRLRIPDFVLYFVALVVLNSLGVIEALTSIYYKDVIQGAGALSKWAILLGLISVGLRTRFANLKRLGYRPLVLGFITAAAVSLTSLLFVLAAY